MEKQIEAADPHIDFGAPHQRILEKENQGQRTERCDRRADLDDIAAPDLHPQRFVFGRVSCRALSGRRRRWRAGTLGNQRLRRR